jgi:3-oxoacyl-[acyl-carrier-protein] synthase II
VAAPVPSVSIDDAVAISPRAGDGPPAGRADPRRYSKASLIAVIAASEAWSDAGLRLNEPEAGVIVGSGAGGIDVAERQYAEFFSEDWKRVTPYAIPVSIVGMISSEISIALELHGVSHVISTGCTSSTDAISYGAALVRSGEADVILSGGADACVTPGMILGFCRMRAVATRYNDAPASASRPFDRGRDGFVLGEGAWMVVLEREDRARARGARIYATVEGYGSTCDAYHRVQMAPDGEQIVRAMRLAISRSGRALEEIGYVSFHGTSTVLNDAVESRCVRAVFGRRADFVPGSSIKSMIGHPQGASGAAGIVTAALSLHDGFLPPTINQVEPDPACDLDFIPNAGRTAEPAAALCNCLGFGSKNSAIVLGRA